MRSCIEGIRRIACGAAFVLLSALAGCTGGSRSTANQSHPTAPVLASTTQAAVKTSTALAAAPSASLLAHYQDAQTGVVFDYPNVWNTFAQQPDYLGGELPAGYNPPKAVMSFSPSGNVYAKTVLSSLVFTYATKAAPDAAACAAGPESTMGSTTPKTVVIHGITYQEYAGSDAAMCHEQSSIIDLTYSALIRRCVAFERNVNTECFGAGDNKRRLTEDESKALQRHLDSIMQSVTIQQ
jgi:hypothetical protein